MKHALPLIGLLLTFASTAHAQTFACASDSVLLDSEADAELYLWQLLDDVEWADLTDSSPYTGTTTAELTINPVDTAMNGNQYRCLIPSVASAIADSVIFETSLLVVDTLFASTIAFDTAPSGPLCNGDNTISLVQAAPAMGADGALTTVWEEFNGTSWQTLEGLSELSIELINLTGTRIYRQRTDNDAGCSAVYSNELTAEVYASLAPPTVAIASGENQVCYESSPGELVMLTPPTGASGTYEYIWQEQVDGVWLFVDGAEASTFTPQALTESQPFRLLATDSVCGSTVVSNVLDIDVYAPLSATINLVAADSPLCDDNTGTSISMEEFPTGGGDGFTYQWYLDGSPLQDEIAQTLSTGFLEATSTIVVEATSTAGCGIVNSEPLTVEVYDALALGMTTSDQTVCYGFSPMTLTNPGATGASGTFAYQWESNSGAGWEPIDGANGTSLSPGALTSDMEYRLTCIDAQGCGAATSNAVAIDVLEPLAAPTVAIVAGDASICYNTFPGELNAVIPPSGGSGEYQFNWQVHLGGGQWSSIAGANDETFSPGQLVSDQEYRLQAIDVQCGTITFSNVLSIEVHEPLSDPMVIVAAEEYLCAINTGNFLEVVQLPSGGGEDFTYQWYSDGNEVSGSWTTGYYPGPLTSTTTFDVVATSSEGCGDVSSNALTVVVYEPLSLGTTSADQTICYGTTPATLDNPGAAGASGLYSYQWEANVGMGWSAVGGATAPSFNPGDLTSTTEFRLSVTDDEGCGSLLSNAITVTVLDEVIPALVSSNVETICYGSGFAVESAGASGADGEFAEQWFIQLNNGGFSLASDLDELSWSVLEAQNDYDIYLESTSEFGCGTYTSNEIHVEVLDPISAPAVAWTGYMGEDLCYGSASPSTTVSSSATGADGDWSNAWQVAAMTGPWIDVQFNEEDLVPFTLTDTVQIRMQSISDFGCGTYYSNELLVPVWAELSPGMVGPGLEQIICYDTPAATFIAQPATGGGEAFIMQWYSDADGVSLPIDGANSLLYQTPALTDTTQYYVEYTNVNGCGAVYSETMQISVLPDLEEATVVGWDGNPLCFNTPVDLLASELEDYPWLNHQWYEAADGQPFEPIAGMSEIELTNHPLTEITSLYMETSSVYGCGTVESDTLTVYVLGNLVSPEIAFTDDYDGSTLCYEDLAPGFTAQSLASGGGGPLQYAWELDTDLSGNFAGTGEEQPDSFNPGLVTDTLSVRLRVTDAYGCGTLVSNALQVNVFEPLAFEVQPLDDVICYGTAPQNLSAVPTGGGDQYAFQWFIETGEEDFAAIADQNDDVLNELILVQDTLIFVELTSLLGCGVIESDTVLINVLDSLIPGQLTFVENPICAEEYADVVSSGPSGGYEGFDYTWYQLNADEWEVVQEGGEDYQSDSLFINTSYYVSYTDACGIVSSDPVEITVNPLPEINAIQGNGSPCYGSSDQLYTIPYADLTLEYEWNVDPNFGTITSGETVGQVLVDWNDETGATGLEVLVTNPVTTCNELFSFEVEITDVMAPPASIVVKKPNINILVSADSTDCAQYLWGTQDIATGEIIYFNELNEQYAYFEVLDTLNYYYFVEVVYDCGDGPSCPTINYYNYDPYVGIESSEAPQLIVFPNPVRETLYVTGSELYSVSLYTLNGEAVQEILSPSREFAELNVSGHPPGIYLLRLSLTSGAMVWRRVVIQ